MTFNPLPAEARKASIEALQPLLASSLYLALTAKHAHWNVKAPAFIGIHRLFDELKDAADEWADTIAERIRFMGAPAKGSPEAIASDTMFALESPEVAGQGEYIELLCTGLAALSTMYRDRTNALSNSDPFSSNMLQDLGGKVDHYIYLLESHLG